MLIKNESRTQSRQVRQHFLPNITEQTAQAEQNRRAFREASNKLQWALEKIDELQLEVELAKRTGFEQGVQAGKEAGWAEGQAKIQEQVSNLAAITKQVHSEQTQLVTSAQEFVVDFVFKILSRLIRTEQIQQAGLDADQLQRVARDAASHFADSVKYVFRLHSDVATLLEEHHEEIERVFDGKASLIIRADASLQPCDCLVETDFGILDARIDSQLREVKRFFSHLEIAG